MKQKLLGFVITVAALGGFGGCAAVGSGTEACPELSASRTPAASFGSPGTAPQMQATTDSKGPDPVVTDGDKYHVILENAEVRVLSYHDEPGDKTQPHHHDKFALYALSPFVRRLIFPDGTIKERAFETGDVIWMPDQIHTGENIGTTDTNVLIVEVKGQQAASSAVPPAASGSTDLP